MKRYLLVMAALCLITCNAIGGDQYEIKGKIANGKGKTIFLERLSHQEMKVVDSSVVKNGNFLLKGNIESIGFYRLKIKPDPTSPNEVSWFMTIDKGEKINAELDESNQAKSNITGSESQAEFQDLARNLQAQQSEMGQLYSQYQQFSKHPESKEATELGSQIEAKSKTFDGYVTKVIQTSKSPLTKYYLYSMLLQQFQQQAVPEQLYQDIKAYSVMMNSSYPNSVYSKDFTTVLANLDMQKKMADAQVNQAPAAAKSKLDVGTPAPNVTLTLADGTKMKVSDFKGKIVLMDFWASWCRPCRMENPNVVAAYNKFKNKDFIVLSISQDQDLDKWQMAAKQDQLNWPTQFADKLSGGEASQAYEVNYIPKTYLLDKNGNIAAKDLRGAALDAAIEKLINQPASTTTVQPAGLKAKPGSKPAKKGK